MCYYLPELASSVNYPKQTKVNMIFYAFCILTQLGHALSIQLERNASMYRSDFATEYPKIAKYLTRKPHEQKLLRVVNGDRVTNNNEAPYYVRLMFCDSNSECGHCGGSWISQRQIITAAHCVIENVNKIYYFKNTNNERREDSAYSGVATGHIIHPEWNGVLGDGKDIV